MFEGWVANFLNRVLGSYVEGSCFRPDKVNASVYSGHVVLSELELRRDLLDSVEAPIKLKRGFIGQVEFKIPWTQLGSRPVEISIDRLFLVVEPALKSEEYGRKAAARKKAALARAELRKGVGKSEGRIGEEAEELAKAGFTARLTNKIVDNMELTVKNVHVRYEDRATNKKHAFSAGFTIESLKMQSTDAKWKACFVDLMREAQKRLTDAGKYLEKLLAYKLFKLNHLAVYWNPNPAPQGGKEIDYDRCTFTEIAAVFGRLIAREREQEEDDFRRVLQAERRLQRRQQQNGRAKSNADATTETSKDSSSEHTTFLDAVARAASANSQQRASRGVDQHRYILRPVSVTFKMRSNRDPRFSDTPNTLLDIEVDSVTVALERFQYLDMLEMLAAFNAAEKSYKYADIRPQNIPKRRNPRVWWQFAIRAIREQVADRLRRYKGDFIETRRRHRLEYMLLWKRNLVGRPASDLQPQKRPPDHSTAGPSSFAGMVTVDESTDPREGATQQQVDDLSSSSTPASSFAPTSAFGQPPTNATVATSSSGTSSSSLENTTGAYSTPPSIRQRRDLMLRGSRQGEAAPQYIELDQLGRARLDHLEDVLEVEDILFFRSLAENELRLERAQFHLYSIEQRRANMNKSGNSTGVSDSTAKAQVSWAGSLFGWAGWAVGLGPSSKSAKASYSSSSSSSSTVQDFPLGMTLEEQETLLSMLDFDPTQILHASGAAGTKYHSPGRIISIQRFRLLSGSLELWDNKEPSKPQATLPTILLDGHFDGLRVRVSNRNNGTSQMKLSLDNLVVFDRCGGNPRFSKIVALKDVSVAEHVSSCLSTVSDGGAALERASHFTPPSYSGIAERMERSYIRRKHSERLNRIRAARLDRLRRQHEAIGGGAAWAATLGGLEVTHGGSTLANNQAPSFDDASADGLHSTFDDEFGYETGEQDESSDEDGRSVPLSRDFGSIGGLRPATASVKGPRIHYPGSSRAQSRRNQPSMYQYSQPPLFSIEVDTFCPDNNADASLRVRTQPLEVVYSKACFEKVAKFFKVPESVFLFKEVQFDTINRFTSIQSRNRAKMEYAFRNHFSVSMDVDIQAPLLIIPQNSSSKKEEDINMVLIDFGRMSIRDRALSTIKAEAAQATFQPSKHISSSKREASDMTKPPTGQSSRKKKKDDGRSKPLSVVTTDPVTASTTTPPSSLPSPTSSFSSNSSPPAAAAAAAAETRATQDAPPTGGMNASSSSRQGDSPSENLKSDEVDTAKFFDEYAISCSNVQVLVTNAAAPWRSIADQHRLRMHIVDQFTFNVVLCVSILQYDRTLPKVKFFASLPTLRVHLSPEKYSSMLRVAESLNRTEQPASGSSQAHANGDKGRVTGEQRISTPGLRSEEFVLDSIAAKTMLNRHSSLGSDRGLMTPLFSPVPHVPDLNSTIASSPALAMMEPLSLGPSSESVVSGATAQTMFTNRDKFVRLPRQSSGESFDGKRRGQPSRLSQGSSSPKVGPSFRSSSSSSATSSREAQKAGTSHQNLDDLETSSVAASLYDTLNTPALDGEELDEDGRPMLFSTHSELMEDIENDFYTTIGSVAHSSFFKHMNSGESVGSFVSALQGDEFDEDELRDMKHNEAELDANTPRARPNVSVLQCSLSIDLIVISVSRRKTDQHLLRKSRHRGGGRGSHGLLSTHMQDKQKEEAEVTPTHTHISDSPLGIQQPPVLKPFVREWLHELQELQDSEKGPLPYTPSRGGSSTKHRRSSSLLHDQVLDEILAGEEEEDEQDQNREEEGLVLIVFEQLLFNASLRSLDTAVDVALQKLNVRNIFGQNVAKLKLTERTSLESLPLVLSSQANVDHRHSRTASATFSSMSSKMESTPDLGPVPSSSSPPGILSLSFKAMAKDSPFYAGVGVQVAVALGAIELDFDQQLVGGLVEAFQSPSSLADRPEMHAQDMDDFEGIGDEIASARESETTKASPSPPPHGVRPQGLTPQPVETSAVVEQLSGHALSNIQSQVIATLKGLIINFVEKRQEPVSAPSPLRPVARVIVSDLELRKVVIDQDQARVSAQLGNLSVVDMVTGIGTTFDQQQRAKHREKQPDTIPEQNALPQDDHSFVQVFGSKRRKNDGRPLLLFQSNIYSAHMQAQRLWAATTDAQHPDGEEALQGNDDVNLSHFPPDEKESEPGRPELDLDEVLDSLLLDSPPGSPKGTHHFDQTTTGKGARSMLRRASSSAEHAVNSTTRPSKDTGSVASPTVGCAHKSCTRRRRYHLQVMRSDNPSANLGETDDTEGEREIEEDAPLPQLPLQSEIRVQLRSVFLRANVEFLQRMIDHFYHGEVFQTLRHSISAHKNRDTFAHNPDRPEKEHVAKDDDENDDDIAVDTSAPDANLQFAKTLGASYQEGRPKESKVESIHGGREEQIGLGKANCGETQSVVTSSLISFQANFHEVSIEFPSTQRGSPMGILAIQNAGVANHFLLGDASGKEREYIMERNPGIVDVMYAIESVTAKVQNASFSILSQSSHTGLLDPFTVMEETSLSCRVVKLLGPAVVFPKVPDVSNRSLYWHRWSILHDKAFHPPTKVKVDMSSIRLRASEEQVVSLLGIYDHFCCLDVPAIQRKMTVAAELETLGDQEEQDASFLSPQHDHHELVQLEVRSFCSCSTTESEPSPLTQVPNITVDAVFDGLSVELLARTVETQPGTSPFGSSATSSAIPPPRYTRPAFHGPNASATPFRGVFSKTRRTGSFGSAERHQNQQHYTTTVKADFWGIKLHITRPTPSIMDGMLHLYDLHFAMEGCEIIDARPPHLRDTFNKVVVGGTAIQQPAFGLASHSLLELQVLSTVQMPNGKDLHFKGKQDVHLMVGGFRVTLVESLVIELGRWASSAQNALQAERLWPPRPLNLASKPSDSATKIMSSLLSSIDFQRHVLAPAVRDASMRPSSKKQSKAVARDSPQVTNPSTSLGKVKTHRRSQSHRLASSMTAPPSASVSVATSGTSRKTVAGKSGIQKAQSVGSTTKGVKVERSSSSFSSLGMNGSEEFESSQSFGPAPITRSRSLDSVSVAPVQSWVSELSDRSSEAGRTWGGQSNTSPLQSPGKHQGGSVTIRHGQGLLGQLEEEEGHDVGNGSKRFVRMAKLEQTVSINLKVHGLAFQLLENPKQTDSKLLAVQLDTSLKTLLCTNTRFSLRGVLSKSGGNLARFFFFEQSRPDENVQPQARIPLASPSFSPEWQVRLSNCTMYFTENTAAVVIPSASSNPSKPLFSSLGSNASLPELVHTRSSPGMQVAQESQTFGIRASASSSFREVKQVASRSSSLVEPFSVSIEYKQARRSGYRKLLVHHDLDIMIGEIESRITYREIRIITGVFERLAQVAARLAFKQSSRETVEDGDDAIQRIELRRSGSVPATHSEVPFVDPSGRVFARAGATTRMTSERPRTAQREGKGKLREELGLDTSRVTTPSHMMREKAAIVQSAKAVGFQTRFRTAAVKIKQGSARFLLVDDMYGQLTPVMEVQLKSFLASVDFGRKSILKLSAQQTLAADYFNHRLSTWEPLVEEWSFRVDGKIPLTPEIHRGRTPVTLRSVALTSQEVLNVNVTEAFVEAISGARNLWNPGQLGKREDLVTSSTRSQLGMYRIRNDTGLGIAYWDAGSSDGHVFSLASGEEASVRVSPTEATLLVSRDAGQQQKNNSRGKRVSILVKAPTAADCNDSWNYEVAADQTGSTADNTSSPWLPIKDIPLDRDGSYEYLLRPSFGTVLSPIGGVVVVCDVVSVGSSKVLYVRSNLMIRNRCVGPVEVHVPHSAEQTSNLLFQKKLAPGEVVSVPVHIAHLLNSKATFILLRPLAYGRAFRFRPLSFPNALGEDCSESSSLRTTLHFTSDVGPSTPATVSSESEISSFLAVDCRSGRDAIEGLRLDQSWEIENQMINSQKHANSTAGHLAMLAQRLKSWRSDAENRRKRQSSSVQGSRTIAFGTSIRLLSFESPLLLSNLLATPLTYRLRSLTTTSSSAADGQLHVGGTLRWQGVDPDAELSLMIRLPGFDWSSVLRLEGVSRNGQPPETITQGNRSVAESDGTDAGVLKRPLTPSLHGTVPFGESRWSDFSLVPEGSSVVQHTIQLKDANRRSLSVCVEVEQLPGGARKVVLFVPYWIVNASDLHLLVRSASRSASLAETFGGHIAAGQNEAIAVMRRMRMRQKLGERFYYHQKGLTGQLRAPGGLLDILDDPDHLRGERRMSEPLMFSYTDTRKNKGRICVKTADSGWSQPMGLDSAGTSGLIELKQQWNVKSDAPRQVFVLGVSISVADGRFHRTKVITLTPRFVLINALGRTLKIKQRQQFSSGLAGSHGLLGLSGLFSRVLGLRGSASSQVFAQASAGAPGSILNSSEAALGIRPGERTPFHWWDLSAPREICVRFDEYGWIWSGGFAIDNIGEFYVRLRNEHTHAVYILRVDVSLDKSTREGSTILITFRPELPGLPPYRIDNLSLQTLRLQQKGAATQTQQVLLPYHSCPYTWDDLSLPRKLVVESLANKSAGKSKWTSGGETVREKAFNFVGGFWSMLWDQSGSHMDVNKKVPLTLGDFELDRLQVSRPCPALPHINVSVHADGPTRVLSIVDARNKGQPKGETTLAPASDLPDEWWPTSLLGASHEDLLEDSDTDSEFSTAESFLLHEHIQPGENVEPNFALDFIELDSAQGDAAKEKSDARMSNSGQDNAHAQSEISLGRQVAAQGSDGMELSPSSMDANLRGTDLSVSLDRSFDVNQNPPAGRAAERKPQDDRDGKDILQRLGSSAFGAETQRGAIFASEVHLSLKGIGISVVESSPRRELVYVSVLDIKSEFGEIGDQSRLVVKVGWIQADNQLYGTYYPVMLAPRSWNRAAISHDHFYSSSRKGNSTRRQEQTESETFTDQTRSPSFALTSAGAGDILAHDEGGKTRPFAEFCLLRSTKFASLDFVRYVSALVLPMNLKLEPELLSACLHFMTRCMALTDSASMHQRNEPVLLPGSLPLYTSGFAGGSVSKMSSSRVRHGAGVAPRYAARGVILSGGREAWNYSILVNPEAGLSRTASDGSNSRDRGDESPNGSPTGANGGQGRPSSATALHRGGENLPATATTSGHDSGKGGNQSGDNLHGLSISGRSPTLGSASTGVAASTSRTMSPEVLPSSQRKLYIEELHIHPVKVHVSFSFRTNLRPTQRSGGEGFSPPTVSLRENLSLNPLRFALNAMGASLANVENAPLRLNALVLHNSLSTRDTIMERILGHYRSQALRQAYLILGSVDLLGDPRGLVQNLGAGVLDFFYEPALGLVRSPKDFGAGIAKGTLSLFRRIVLGAATSATGFANGASALFDTLSNDRYTGYKPKSVAEGVVQGIAGLVVAPMNGLNEEGVVGFGQGALLGLLGLFVKPLAGVLKLVKRVSVAIQSTIDPTVKYRRHRIRPPRSFRRLHEGSMRAGVAGMLLLEPFDYFQAVGEEVLAMVDHGQFLEEGHVDHILLQLPELLPEFSIEDVVGQENQVEEASMIYSFYTHQVQRPFPSLSLWNKMYLLATREHLLYVEAITEEYHDERSAWVVPLASIERVEAKRVMLVPGRDFDPDALSDFNGDSPVDSDGTEKIYPALVHWVITLYYCFSGSSLDLLASASSTSALPNAGKLSVASEQSAGGIQNSVAVYAWTEEDANRCVAFVEAMRQVPYSV